MKKTLFILIILSLFSLTASPALAAPFGKVRVDYSFETGKKIPHISIISKGLHDDGTPFDNWQNATSGEGSANPGYIHQVEMTNRDEFLPGTTEYRVVADPKLGEVNEIAEKSGACQGPPPAASTTVVCRVTYKVPPPPPPPAPAPAPAPVEISSQSTSAITTAVNAAIASSTDATEAKRTADAEKIQALQAQIISLLQQIITLLIGRLMAIMPTPASL